MKGNVILVGAGPGDGGLLTLRGAMALQNAQVVVYDRLVGEDVLAMIPEQAEKINVGKENNHHPVPQPQINAILVQKAKEGKCVVRLKGGDCYLFGRGGEEVEELLRENISFEVVPGVTSALSAPAYAGIPITHRDFCSSVHIITAHAKRGSDLHIDFKSLLNIGGTLVFLMGVTSLGFLMNGLLSAGASPDLPAAVIENGTRFNQRKLVATVETLEKRTQEMGLHSPAIIVVGPVCNLSKELDWFTKMPLHGVQVVVTRPKVRMGTIANRLRALGAGVIEYPCIETVDQTAVELPQDLTQYKWVVLTSPAGIDAMVHCLQANGKDMRALYGCKFAAIGAGTAAELKKLGIEADYIPEKYDAYHLAEGLRQMVSQEEKLLILRSSIGSKVLTDELSDANISYDEIWIYETHYRNQKSDHIAQEIQNENVQYVTFTSASTVKGFIQATPNVDVTKFQAICIGEATAEVARKYNMNVVIAKNATIDDMIACILEGNKKWNN